MPALATLYASNVLQLAFGGFHPNLEAAILSMAYGTTLLAVDDVLGGAVTGSMTNLIAFEA